MDRLLRESESMKKTDIDPNWWRAVIAPIAVTSALIVAACISGLPSTTCAALAKTYIDAVHNFGFSALLASTLFLFCMFVSASADSGQSKMNTHVVSIVATIAAAFIFAWAISAGIGSLNESIADCYPGSRGEAAPSAPLPPATAR
jgi:cobalamin synthase